MILGGLKKNFPYPEKLCPYCNKPLIAVNAIHSAENIYNFKVLYFDNNIDCPAYDEGARLAYARIYYSSQEAYNAFYNVEIPVQRWSQKYLYSIYK